MQRGRYGLGAVRYAELSQNIVDVALNCRFANRKAGADFFIALTAHIGGTLSIQSTDGSGTEVVADVPISN